MSMDILSGEDRSARNGLDQGWPLEFSQPTHSCSIGSGVGGTCSFRETLFAEGERSLKPIEAIAELSGPLSPGFNFYAASIPAGKSYTFRGRHCDVDTLNVPSTSGHLWIWATLCADRGDVAWAIFGAGALSVQCCDISVHEDLRRKGIAIALYRLAACLFEAPAVPTDRRSRLSLEFWKGRTTITC